jgi:hypothetical protein
MPVVGTSAQIIEIAQRAGIPYGETLRWRSTPTRRGGRSHHQDDNAVDFMGYSQDALAELFVKIPTLEVFHFSEATGKWYGVSKGKPVDPAKNQDLVKEHKNHLHVAMSPEQVGPGSFLDNLRKGLASVGSALSPALGALGGFIPNPGNVTDALGNVGKGIYSIAESAAGVGHLANTITQLFLPTKLMRAFAFVFGTIFLLIGIWFLAREVKESKQ